MNVQEQEPEPSRDASLSRDAINVAHDPEGGEWCHDCGVYLPDVTDGIADHYGKCGALDFRKALELLALGVDETYGWNSAHLEEAERLINKYPRTVSAFLGGETERDPSGITTLPAPRIPPRSVQAVEVMLRRHMAMYDWKKGETRAINDFILTTRFGIAEELATSEVAQGATDSLAGASVPAVDRSWPTPETTEATAAEVPHG